MMNRVFVAMMTCSALNAACDLETTQQQAEARAVAERKAAADQERHNAEAAKEQQFSAEVEAKRYVGAARFAMREKLFDAQRRQMEIQRLLSNRAGEIEGAHAPERFNGYRELARLAKWAWLPSEISGNYAAAAFRAGASVDNLEIVAAAALLAKEFDVELDGRWRAAARIWTLRIEQQGWPDNGNATAFVDAFPLSGRLAPDAYAAAMELGHWRAARMIAERAQLPQEQFRAARAKEVEDIVAEAIRTRNDQRILGLNLEAPGFVDATVIRTVAERVVMKLVADGKPMEAYGLAIAHGLDVERTKQVADAVFERALKAGAFSMGRQMPDGTFVIINHVPPPASPAPMPSPPVEDTGYRGARGH